MQLWVSEHFQDFEGQTEMEEFLDWFENRLLKDVSVTVCDPSGETLV